MELIQFLVEIILRSFTEAQIQKKQPFISSLFRWIIVRYLCFIYTLMPCCFSQDTCSAICNYVLETVLAKSLPDSWSGKELERRGGREVGWWTKHQQRTCFPKKASAESLRRAAVKPRLPPHTSCCNSPSSAVSQTSDCSCLFLVCVSLAGKSRCLWAWFIEAQIETS